MTGVGLGIGIAGALALTRLMASLLFNVTPHDPWTLVVVEAVLQPSRRWHVTSRHDARHA